MAPFAARDVVIYFSRVELAGAWWFLQALSTKSKADNKKGYKSPFTRSEQDLEWENISESSVAARHVIEDTTSAGYLDSSMDSHTSQDPLNMSMSMSMSMTQKIPSGRSLKDKSQRQPRILIVDDSNICQKIVVSILKRQSYATDVANNGQEACAKLSHVPCLFDAVLMDLRMPIMDGISATKYCRETLKLKLPIIVLSAELGEETRQQALDARATHFVSKPAKADEILGALQKYLGH